MQYTKYKSAQTQNRLAVFAFPFSFAASSEILSPEVLLRGIDKLKHKDWELSPKYAIWP